MEWELFGGVPSEDVQRVLAVARRRRFERGEVVFHQDDLSESLHLVVSGRFAITRRTALGEDALLAIRQAGEAFGELALISERRRSATVSALENGETLTVLYTDFEQLRTRHPGVDRMLIALLASQLERMDQLLTEAYYETAEHRVVRRLLDLSHVYGSGDQPIQVTQDQLAALAGTSRATVNAVLSEERRRGTIDVKRGATRILDREALMRRSGTR
jgi:CRP/FNR family transcriptional regulator, cyclic AMP receptor protein